MPRKHFSEQKHLAQAPSPSALQSTPSPSLTKPGQSFMQCPSHWSPGPVPRAATPPRLAWASLAPALGSRGRPGVSSAGSSMAPLFIPGSTPCSRKPRSPTLGWGAQRRRPQGWESGAGVAGETPIGKPGRTGTCPGHRGPLSEAGPVFPVASRSHEETKLLSGGSCPVGF